MDIDKLRWIIIRSIIGKATEEELQELDGWAEDNMQRKQLLKKLGSSEFLQDAITSDRKIRREKEWKKFLQHRNAFRRKVWLYRIRNIAAVVIPLIVVCSVWLLINKQPEMKDQNSVTQIVPGDLRAIVELVGGEKIYLARDSVVDMEIQGGKLINQGDTLRFTNGNHKGEAKKKDYHIIQIPRGGEYVALLEDGTLVHLNSESELKIPVTFAGERFREVWLKGEGYFEVSKNPEHPFVVRTEHADICVLGTRFNVNAHRVDGVLETTLVEGKVQVTENKTSDKIVLHPNEQARIYNGKITVCEVDAESYISWVNGKFCFEAETLEEIAAQLERWYGVNFFFTRQELQKRKFTGSVFRDEKIEQILRLLEQTANVKFNVNGNVITVN